MSKRNRREHGRILSVETMQRGSALDAAAAAGSTSITVTDAGDFDEDGGWLYIGAQVVQFTECDDDTGIITLAEPLTAAAEQGDPVAVYDPLYGEVVDYQVALVQLDGDYDNPDPVEAEVAEGVEDLPEGDRGNAGESCTLKRVGDDEWEVISVGGRPRKSRGLRAEADDYYILTPADIAAGTATFRLSHRPADEWVILWWRTTPQEPTEYQIDYDAQTITIPLGGFEGAGDRIWVHYAYRKGLHTNGPTVLVPYQATGWRWHEYPDSDTTDRSAATFDDTGWATVQAAFANYYRTPEYPDAGFPSQNTGLSGPNVIAWLRRTVTVPSWATSATFTARRDGSVRIYLDGALVADIPDQTTWPGDSTPSVDVAVSPGDHVLAVRLKDDAPDPAGDAIYIDVQMIVRP